MKDAPAKSKNPPAANQPEEDKRFWAGQWAAAAARVEALDAPTWANDLDQVLLDCIRPYLPSNGTVVELGCGSARLLIRIGRERTHLRLVAVDYESEALDLVQAFAKECGVSIETHLDDVNHLSYPDDSFDMVWSGGVLEHFVDPRPVLSEMVRTLKPGGAFMAAVVPRKIFSLHRPLHRFLGPKIYRTSHDAYQYARWLEELEMQNVVALTKGFYPPFLAHLPARPRRAVERVFRRFDGSWLADRLGYFFVVAGRK